MQLRFLLLLLGGTLLGCASAPPPPPAQSAAAAGETAGEVQHPALRRELLAMRDADQAVRAPLMAALGAGVEPDSALLADMLAVDAAHLQRMREIVQTYGWPDEAMVGRDGRSAVWLLVQHAGTDDIAFQKDYLAWLERAFHAGELSPDAGQDLALLTDKVRVNEGRPQLYGTQFDVQDGRVIAQPIEDEANVDARRAALGLPPLAEYLAMMRQLLGLPQ